MEGKSCGFSQQGQCIFMKEICMIIYIVSNGNNLILHIKCFCIMNSTVLQIIDEVINFWKTNYALAFKWIVLYS